MNKDLSFSIKASEQSYCPECDRNGSLVYDTKKKHFRCLVCQWTPSDAKDTETRAYQYIANWYTQKAERDKQNIGDIYVNAIQCVNCHDIIISRNKHDYRSCDCGNVSVDGGSHYTKRSFCEKGDFADLSISFLDVICKNFFEEEL